MIPTINSCVFFWQPADWGTLPAETQSYAGTSAAALTGRETRQVLRSRPYFGLKYTVISQNSTARAELEASIQAAIKTGRAGCPWWGRAVALAGAVTPASTTVAVTSARAWVGGDYLFLLLKAAGAGTVQAWDALKVASASQTGPTAWTLTLEGGQVPSATYPSGALAWPCLFGTPSVRDQTPEHEELAKTVINISEPLGSAVNRLDPGAEPQDPVAGDQTFCLSTDLTVLPGATCASPNATLQWTTNPYAAAYKIYRADTASSTLTLLATITDPTASTYTVARRYWEPYYYAVTVVIGTKEGGFSERVWVKPWTIEAIMAAVQDRRHLVANELTRDFPSLAEWHVWPDSYDAQPAGHYPSQTANPIANWQHFYLASYQHEGGDFRQTLLEDLFAMFQGDDLPAPDGSASEASWLKYFAQDRTWDGQETPKFMPAAAFGSTAPSYSKTELGIGDSTYTIDTVTNELVIEDHGLVYGDRVCVRTVGAYPTGLSAAFDYYVAEVTSSSRFKVSKELGGPVVAITWAGSSDPQYVYFVATNHETVLLELAADVCLLQNFWFLGQQVDKAFRRVRLFLDVPYPKSDSVPYGYLPSWWDTLSGGTSYWLDRYPFPANKRIDVYIDSDGGQTMSEADDDGSAYQDSDQRRIGCVAHMWSTFSDPYEAPVYTDVHTGVSVMNRTGRIQVNLANTGPSSKVVANSVVTFLRFNEWAQGADIEPNRMTYSPSPVCAVSGPIGGPQIATGLEAGKMFQWAEQGVSPDGFTYPFGSATAKSKSFVFGLMDKPGGPDLDILWIPNDPAYWACYSVGWSIDGAYVVMSKSNAPADAHWSYYP